MPLPSIREEDEKEEEEEEEEESSLLRKRGGRRPTPSPLEQLGHDSFSDREGEGQAPLPCEKGGGEEGPLFPSLEAMRKVPHPSPLL